MPELAYSDDALNVLGAFYNSEKLLYVEGEDDVVFWEVLLDKLGKKNLKVQSVGGIEELKKYIHKVATGAIDANVARDADFTHIEKKPRERGVIYTYGHSVENTIFSATSICTVIRTYGRVTKRAIDEGDCESWLSDFHAAFAPLVTYDAANEIGGHGLSVLTNNCTRFMLSELSPIPDPAKIQQKIGELSLNPDIHKTMMSTHNKINKCRRTHADLIRGHFLMSATLKYMNSKLKRLSGNKKISVDALFSNAMLAFESTFNRSHRHFSHYKRQVSLL